MRFGPEDGIGEDGPPRDGHKLGITASQNDFMKEIYSKDAQVLAAFKANKTVYRSTRNCILAEPTPREPTRRRLTDEEFRKSKEASGMGRFGKTLTTYQGTEGQTAVETSEAEAHMVDVELEKLYSKKQQIETKVKELNRLLEYS